MRKPEKAGAPCTDPMWIFQSGKMVCLIINGKSLPHGEKLVEALRKIDGMTSISLNCNTERTNVILGHKTIVLWGQEYITDQIGDISYEISPVSFYQVNPVQTEKLYGLALGICRSARGRDRVGSVLRYRNNLPVPGSESETGVWRGDYSTGHRKCEAQCSKELY